MAKTIKTDRNGFPKRIAGVKVPKALRKPAAMLIDKARTPEGQAMIVKGVGAVMAFAAATRAQAAHAPKPKMADAPVTSDAPTPPPGATGRTPPPAPPVPPVPPKPEAAKGPAAPGVGGTTTAPEVEKVVEAISVAADAVFARLFKGKMG